MQGNLRDSLKGEIMKGRIFDNIKAKRGISSHMKYTLHERKSRTES